MKIKVVSIVIIFGSCLLGWSALNCPSGYPPGTWVDITNVALPAHPPPPANLQNGVKTFVFHKYTYAVVSSYSWNVRLDETRSCYGEYGSNDPEQFSYTTETTTGAKFSAGYAGGGISANFSSSTATTAGTNVTYTFNQTQIMNKHVIKYQAYLNQQLRYNEYVPHIITGAWTFHKYDTTDYAYAEQRFAEKLYHQCCLTQ